MTITNIGFVGYSRPLTADQSYRYYKKIRETLAANLEPDGNYNLISGTGSGPELAYQAFRELFPTTSSFRTCLVPEKYVKYHKQGSTEMLLVVPKNDSEVLMQMVNFLIVIGGGEQARKEVLMAEELGIKRLILPYAL
jgi:hypothetical protein